MEKVATQSGSTEPAYTEGYNRGTEIGSNLVKGATDVGHSTTHVVSEGAKSIEEILHESEQKTAAVSSKIGEVIHEGVKSSEETLDKCEQTVESAYTEGLSKSSEFVTATGVKVGKSVKLAESSIKKGYTHSVDTATEVCTKVAEISGQVADATVHTVTEGVKTVQNVLTQTEEKCRVPFNKGLDIAATVGTKTAEIAGEIVGGTVQVAENIWTLVNKPVEPPMSIPPGDKAEDVTDFLSFCPK